ncbi:MAG TPA: AAA family ATPase [Candidatus Acidoferrum sp.]|nr:AAA family ATPase [Candidatus Acidoferrum sp.]
MSLFDGFTLSHPSSEHTNLQTGFNFPQSLTEKYRPKTFEEFAGMDKQKRILTNFARNPYPTAFLFVGAPGTGKTCAGIALAQAIPAEVHHIPSQECNVSNIERRMYTCHMVPASGFKMHLVLVDEADQMSTAAQLLLLSKLDGTAFPPNTVFVFTCNAVDRLEDRFLSRCKVLEFSTYGLAADAVSLLARVWQTEAPSGSESPNFARIVKESNNNVRESLQRLETELLAI